jgi:hypothetical protein
MSVRRYLASYLVQIYPKGRVRVALKEHHCNGWLNDPGCGCLIRPGESYFDTMERNEFWEAGRFCRRCAIIAVGQPDLFDIEAKRPHLDRQLVSWRFS